MTKDQLIASIRGQLLAKAHDFVISELAEVSLQLEAANVRVKELEAELATAKAALDSAPVEVAVT
jgi:hypothetical protein